MTIYPLAKETRYRNDDGTGAIETSYSYAWHSDSLAYAGAGDHAAGHCRSAERLRRLGHADRAVRYAGPPDLAERRAGLHYVPCVRCWHGNLTQPIQDVDDGQLSVPSGWSTPSGGGLHLVTDYEYDEQGRQTQVLGPEHDVDGVTVRTASWTVYQDADRETWCAGLRGGVRQFLIESGGDLPNYDYTLVNPVSIQKRNAAGTRAESIQATRASTSGKLLASDTFAQSSYVRWTVSLSNTQGQHTATRVYHTIPASGDGSAGTNYDETTYGYDALGRQNMVKSPGGTITRTVFDKRGRVGLHLRGHG